MGLWVPLGVVREEFVNGRLVQRSQVGDVLLGGRAGLAVADGFMVEGSLALSPGHVARTDSSGTADLPGLAVLAGARLIRVTRLASDFDGLLGVGLGVIRRSGRGWERTRVARAIVVALGLQLELGPGSAFRTEFEIYASRTGRAALPPDPPRQAWRGDLVLSFGIVLPSPRRASN